MKLVFMRFSCSRLRRSLAGAFLSSAFLLIFSCGFASFAAAQGLFRGGETRSLKIYFVHTNERDDVVFKKNGRYVRSGLRRLDYLTRDWRRNEAANMDPRLFDLIWQIYRLSGSKDYIHVVSGYRSPQTNAMLRLSSPASGVARHSRHMEGKAMDFYLPDVNLAYLRAIALKLQGGGIGYYPDSGSPFVHVDVGSVRHWPRMSAPALAALFPDGKSLHVPASGRPLAAYMTALAEYRQRGALPLAVFSPRRLFAGLSSRQVILAAADGKLPHLQGSRALDLRGISGAGSLPAAPPEAVAPAPLLAGLSGAAPIPAAAPHWAAEQREAAEDEADAAAPAPVPQFKEEAVKREILAHYEQTERGKAEHDEIGALLAYAPLPREESAGGAFSALTEIIPVPGAKPPAAAKMAPVPLLKSEAAPEQAAAGAAAQNAAVPVPRFKEARR